MSLETVFTVPHVPNLTNYFSTMLPLIVVLTPLLNFLLMATFGRLVN